MHAFSYPKQVLSIYLDRGRKILTFLQEGKDVDAVEWVSLHRAAFHNFLAVEAKYGISGMDQQALQRIWVEIEIVNQQIVEHMSRLIQTAQNQLISIQKEKNRLRKFRSFPMKETTFQRSI